MAGLSKWCAVMLAAAGCCLMAADARADLIVTEGTQASPYVIDTPQDVYPTGSPYLFRVGTSAGDGYVRIDAGGSVYSSGSDAGYTTVGAAAAGTVVLNGGSLYTAASPRTVRLGSSGGTGSLIIDSGDVYAKDVDLGYGDGWGEVIVNGGTLNVGGGYFGIRVGMSAGGSIGGGLIRQTGGTINVTSKNVNIGYAGGTLPCTLAISGGTYNQTSGGMYVGTASSGGTLHVDGSGATSIDMARFYSYAGYSMFLFTLDAGGVTTVGVNYAYTTSLSGTLDMEADVSVAAGEYFDLMTTTGTGINGSGLTLAAGDEEFWELQLADDGHTLRAFCVKAIEVPEPATMGLLGFGVASLLMGRRNRRA